MPRMMAASHGWRQLPGRIFGRSLAWRLAIGGSVTGCHRHVGTDVSGNMDQSESMRPGEAGGHVLGFGPDVSKASSM